MGKRIFRKLENFICVRYFDVPLLYTNVVAEVAFLRNSKRAFKNRIRNMLVSIMKNEDDSVEMPIPLQKIANFVVLYAVLVH